MNATSLLIVVGGVVVIVAIVIVPKVKKVLAKRKFMAQYNKELVEDYVRGIDADSRREAEETSFTEMLG